MSLLIKIIKFIKRKREKNRSDFEPPKGRYAIEEQILGSELKVYDIILMEDGKWYDIYSISGGRLTLYKDGEKIPKTLYRNQYYKCMRFIEN